MIGKNGKECFVMIKKIETKKGNFSRIKDGYNEVVSLANPISIGYPIIIKIEMPEGESARMFLTTDVERIKAISGENKFSVETATSIYEVTIEE